MQCSLQAFISGNYNSVAMEKQKDFNKFMVLHEILKLKC